MTNPFVGPRSIDRGQKIFGRDREIEELYYLLSAERIVLFHSPSGAGKTSLIQAGLLPRLSGQFDVWGPTRVNLPLTAANSTGVNRYVSSANFGFESLIPKDRQRPAEQISAMTLADYAAQRPHRRSNIVLLFDQFEEILTVDPLALETKHEFFDQLGELLLNPHIWALFALREDYLAPLDPYAQQVPTHFKNRFRLDLLAREAAREAISKSAEGGGRRSVPGAVEKLVNDLATMQVQRPDGTFESQTGPFVEPLYLQVACRGLWEQMPDAKPTIDLDDVQSFGDVTNALAEYYEGEVAEIASGDQGVERAMREWVGQKLITPDGIRGQVLKGAGRSEGLDNELIGRLVDAHLVRGEQRTGAVWFELSHDRLIEPVRTNNAKWFQTNLGMLQREAGLWDTQNRPKGLLLRGQSLVQAEDWASRHKGEVTPAEVDFLKASQEARREAKRLRWMRILSIGGFACAACALIVFVYMSVVQARMYKTQQAATRAAVAAGDDANRKAKEVREQAKEELDEASKKLGDAKTEEEQLSRKVRLSNAAGLAIQSQKAVYIDKLPELSLLQAIEAIRTVRPDNLQTSTPVNALLEALAHAGGQVIRGNDERPGADMAISPDRHWLVTVANTGDGRLWDLTTEGSGSIPLVGARQPVKISDEWAITSSADGTIRLWDLTKPIGDPITLQSAKLGNFLFGATSISADGHWIVTAGAGKEQSTNLWDLTLRDPGAGPSKSLEGRTMQMSPDGRWIVTTSGVPCKDQKTYLWDLRSKDLSAGRRTLEIRSITLARFSANGEFLLAAGGCYQQGNPEESIRWWDLKQPQSSGTALMGKDPELMSSIAISANRAVAETFDAAYIWELNKPSVPKKLGHEGGIRNESVFSLDGRLLFSFEQNQSWILDGNSEKRLRDADGEEISFESTPRVTSDSHWVFLFSKSRPIVLDLTQPDRYANPNVLAGHDNYVTSADFKPSSNTVVTRSTNGTIRMWDLTKSPPIANPIILPGTISSDDHWLAAISANDNTAKLWDLTSPFPLSRSLPGKDKADLNQTITFQFSGDSHWRRTMQGSVAQLWSLTSIHSGTKPVPLEKVSNLIFSPNNHWLAGITLSDNTAKLWDLTSPLTPRSLPVDPKIPTNFQFSSDSRWLLTMQRGIAQLWSLANTGPGTAPAPFDRVANLCFSPDNHWLVANSMNDKTIKLWDLTSPLTPRSLPIDPKIPTGFRFSNDGRWLATMQGSAWQLWNLTSAHPGTNPVALDKVTNLLFSPDSHWLIATSLSDNIAKLWDLTSPLTACRSLLTDARQATFQFSNDGRWLASMQGGAAQIWSLTSTHPDAKLPPVGVTGLKFSPDNHWLAISLSDTAAKLWDLEAKNPAPAISLTDYHGGPFTFIPNSHWLEAHASGGDVRLWEIGAGMADTVLAPLVLPTRNKPIQSVALSSDGGWVMGQSNGQVLLWSTRVQEDLIPLACRTAGRNLTLEEWNRFLPGEPYRKTCPEFPAGTGVEQRSNSPADSKKKVAGLRGR